MTPETSTRGATPADADGYATVMRRAIELSLNGPAHDANPRVGCVVLDAHGTVIAEGWHRGAGTPHAEVDALSQLSPAQVRGATFVVTLEPCNHTGRTGPCADELLAAGVARVVFGLSDPGDFEGGGGDKLRAAGIEVVAGVGADDVMAVVRDWYDSAALGRAVVTIKWASSLDGRAAANDGTSQWISGERARERGKVGCAGVGRVVVDLHVVECAVDGVRAGPARDVDGIVEERAHVAMHHLFDALLAGVRMLV